MTNKTKMIDGFYITKAGSTLKLSANGGRSEVSFDWLEELTACCDCVPNAYPDSDGYLVWHCEVCGGGKAKLELKK